VSGFTKILRTEGVSSLYAGFIPILAKQVPYAIGMAIIRYPEPELTLRSIHRKRAMHRVHLQPNVT
jgi:solute carrier family 25 phosphate transporter 3